MRTGAQKASLYSQTSRTSVPLISELQPQTTFAISRNQNHCTVKLILMTRFQKIQLLWANVLMNGQNVKQKTQNKIKKKEQKSLCVKFHILQWVIYALFTDISDNNLLILCHIHLEDYKLYLWIILFQIEINLLFGGNIKSLKSIHFIETHSTRNKASLNIFFFIPQFLRALLTNHGHVCLICSCLFLK